MGRRALELGEHGAISATPQHLQDGKWRTAPSARQADRWRARAQYRDHAGERHELSAFAKTRKAAEAALADQVRDRQVSDGAGTLTRSTPLREAGQVWLDYLPRRASRPPRASTLALYRSVWVGHLMADGSPVSGLTLAQCAPQRLGRALLWVADRSGDGTARTARSVLSGVLGYAVSQGVLDANPVKSVEMQRSSAPKRESDLDHKRSFTREQRDYAIAWADAQVRLPAYNARTTRARQAAADLVAVLAGLGLRIDEARGLRWENVDLAGGTVYVAESKTEAGKRLLNLPEWLRERLTRRAAQGGQSGFVLSSPGVTDPEARWERRNSLRAVRRILDGAGEDWAEDHNGETFAFASSHTFRRTVATDLHAAGVPVARIADVLGHDDVATTQSHYFGRAPKGDKADLAALL